MNAVQKSIAVQLQGSQEISFPSVEEFQKIFKIKYTPTLLFQTPDFFQKVVANTPWLLKHSVIGQEHRNLGAALHSKIAVGEVANVAIQWIDEKIGYGVFARENISSEAFVGEYTGVVRQIKRFHPDLNGYCMHYPTKFFSYNYVVIDAQEAGNEMRFVNHSDDPNLKAICLIDRGVQHIGFFALKPISRGEQLTINYGKDYWKKRQKR